MKILVTGLSKGKGGIGTLLLNMARYNNLQRNREKILFEFLLPEGSIYADTLKQAGYSYYETPKIWKIFAYWSVLNSLFSSHTYDFVWINNTSKVNILLPICAKKIGKAKIIQHSHGTASEAKGLKYFMFKLLENIYGKTYESFIDIPLACSAASANYFYRNSELRKKCKILANAIFADKYIFNKEKRDAIRNNELGLNANTILIGAVGRLTLAKNYAFLVKLITILPSRYFCIILGDGEEREVLEKSIQTNKISDRFLLLGDKHNIHDYLSAMDIFAMPSFHEGLPLAMIEAQATGLKCVASEGISREVDVTGTTSFLSLDDINAWKNLCLAYTPNNNREKSNEIIRQKGYCIEETYKIFLKIIDKGDLL